MTIYILQNASKIIGMVATLKQLIKLLSKSNKIWIVPVLLLLIIVALLVISAQISPVPIFLYPIL